MYTYIGSTVNSLAPLSLPPVWSKVALGLALPNFVMAGGLYGHVPAKLIFVRMFRRTKHVYSHTVLGWTIWIGLCLAAAIIAFVFATAVPIFSFLIGLSASLLAAWYTMSMFSFVDHIYVDLKVHIWPCWLFLYPRHILSEGWDQSTEETSLDGACICPHHLCRCFYMCSWDIYLH